MHQSGHNSGVVHAGLYYAPGSVKARLCRQGKAQLETYCERKGIPIQQTGKLVIAATVDELARLDTLRNRAEANGVPGLELIGPEQIREHEPHATGLRALWSPTTGIVDFRRVALAYAEDVRALGGTIETSRPVTAVRRRGSELVLSTPHGALTARSIIVCAGLWADSVAALTGDAGPDAPRIIPFRGDYYTLTPDARPLVQGLIYPVPDPRFPFLGVHLTKRHDGEVWAGPNAVLAFKRTGYRRRDVSLRDLASILTYRGFLRLAARYYRVGAAEMWRDWSKRAFLAEIRRYVPDVRANQLMFGPSGVRAQALRPNGTLVDDFDLAGSGRVLHVRNAPSPAATSSLAIATELARAAMERFELG
jgi:L-2-hydroxyglutarate oxidase LhgO